MRGREQVVRSLRAGAAVLLLSGIFCGCAAAADRDTAYNRVTEQTAQEASGLAEEEIPDWELMQEHATDTMELSYADQFSVTYYGDYKLIEIQETGEYLLVPEAGQVPGNLPEDIVVLKAPLENIYLVATSAMDFFCKLDALDRIRFSGTKASGWYLPEAKRQMEEEEILYAGKYSAPDYELLLEEGCGAAVESTMIYHNPKVMEQLQRLGIPVLVEHSSYESHPLGRMEWIRLYGALLGKEDEAEAFFREQERALLAVMNQKQTGKTVAFFSIDSNGAVTVRKSGDYIAKLIALAGGIYVPSDESGEDNALSTTKIQMESFYEAARDADVLIYNSAIEAELFSISELVEREPLMADFAAVRRGQVYGTGKNLFQETTGIGDMLLDVNRVLTGADPQELVYLKKLL